MVLDRKAAQKFASLSALGISALAVGAQKAEASIVYSGAMDTKIGFDSGYPTVNFTGTLTGGAAFKFTLNTTNLPPGRHARATARGTNVVWAFSSGHLETFAKSQTWNAKSGTALHPIVATETAGSPGVFLHNFTSRYALFDFTGGPQLDFGWVELSLSVGDGHGPDLDILGFAYDDSGAKIEAGAQSAATPEPATFALTGLAMMSLGALGVRRYRKARKTANIEA